MYAVIKVGGHQYVVRPGDVIEVQRINADEGSDYVIREVLLAKKEDGEVLIGKPYLQAEVKAKVLEHFKGEKIRGFKYRPKKRYRRRWGHRQPMTKLKIEKIQLS